MAVYHLEAKVISRGAGRSAVAASAYMSCSRMFNDYAGVQHDYTRKLGLAYEHIFLPGMAPAAWSERETLWNAVEEAEKTKDSRLAREFVAALPIELNMEERIALLSEFVQSNFVADGMCTDVCIHDTDGHNPHAHIMLTVRPLNEDGTWQYKTEKEYLRVRDGEERGFTAAELKTAQSEGWEKQYQYKVGKKKAYMPPSEAKVHGYERVSKYPKSTKYGRQNPIYERWNNDEQLVLWRAAWADVTNRHFERVGLQERIDHRSHAARELSEQPTIHEGVIARALEQKGVVSDRCEINRQIKADNRLLYELKVQVERLMRAVKNTVPAIAEAMETVRQNMLIFRYQLLHTWASKRKISDTLNTILPDFRKYTEIVRQLKNKTKERRELLAEKKATPILHVVKYAELSRQITALTEDMEELRSEKNMLLSLFDRSDDAWMREIKQRVDSMEASLQKLEQAETRFASELDSALKQYAELTEQTADMDAAELDNARADIRGSKKQDAVDRLKTAYGKQYDYSRMQRAEKDVSAMLGEEVQTQEKQSIRQQLRKSSERQESCQRKPKEREQER